MAAVARPLLGVVMALGPVCSSAAMAEPKPAAAAETKQLPKDPAKDKVEETRKELDAKREALEANRKREQEIQQDLAKLSAERAKLRLQSTEAATAVQEAETRLTAVETELGELESQEKVLRGSLTQRFGQISKLLSVLQRMGRNPPPVMITKREDALKMVRSAMLVSSAFPEMRAEALSLSAKLNQLVAVMTEAKQKREKTKVATADLQAKRDELALLMETKRQTQAARQTELATVRATAADMVKNVKELNDLIAKLDQTVAKNTGLGAYNEEAQTAPPAGPEVAALPPSSSNALELAPTGAAGLGGKPDRLKPSVLFQQAKAKLPLPVAGRRVLSFGDKTEYGAASKGIVIETRPFAQVTAPCDGWVVFAGEFRSYQRVLIINPGGGYHVLLAGLSQIDATTGQFVVASEPVGTMSGSPAATQGTQQSASPVLYIEFRKDSEPVDPDPWWAGSQKVESGKKVQG